MDAISTGPTCDRCGTSVAARVRYVRGADIWEFCQHHGREHGPALELRGFEVYEVALSSMPDVGSRAVTG